MRATSIKEMVNSAISFSLIIGYYAHFVKYILYKSLNALDVFLKNY